MDILYTCQEPGCPYTLRRKKGRIYTAEIPTHHNQVLKGQQVPGGEELEVTDTTNHRLVISSGGLLIVPLDDLADEDKQDRTPDAILGYDTCQQFSLAEAIRLYEVLGEHIAMLKREMPLVDAYLERVAHELFNTFLVTPQAQALIEKKESRWPWIRREAYHCLIALLNAGANEVINGWYTQAINNKSFPRTQQLEEVLRHFAVLYYSLYPAPKWEPEQEEEEEDDKHGK